jgi:hypothetical protein
MFEWLQNTWKNHGFEIILVVSLIAILILSLYRIGNKGTWSSSYMYNNSLKKGSEKSYNTNTNTNTNRKPPKESSGEKECRRVLQKIFKKPFHNSRPDFLRNPVTGGRFNLELDCYDDILKLAVEYDGQQHYKYIPYFHKNKAVFRNQQYRDYMKKTMCRDNGIRLIVVPYTIKVPDIEKYIVNKLRNYGYQI